MTKKKRTGRTKAQRRRRVERRIEARQQRGYTIATLGAEVERGRGKRRQLGRLTGWTIDGKGRTTWIVSPR